MLFLLFQPPSPLNFVVMQFSDLRYTTEQPRADAIAWSTIHETVRVAARYVETACREFSIIRIKSHAAANMSSFR